MARFSSCECIWSLFESAMQPKERTKKDKHEHKHEHKPKIVQVNPSTQKDYTIVKLNVGGKRFETLRSTLLSIEGTYFTGLIGDCENPSNEYFIDRDGEKFAPILNYLRGDRNTYIDPNEAAFYCLPSSSLCHTFHGKVQKDILFCRAFLEKHQSAILEDLNKYYDLKSNPNVVVENSSVTWPMFRGQIWGFRNQNNNVLTVHKKALFEISKLQQNIEATSDPSKKKMLQTHLERYESEVLPEYEASMLETFTPHTTLFRIFLNEVNLFWKSHGLTCVIQFEKESSTKITFSWAGKEKDHLDGLGKELEYVLNKYNFYGANAEKIFKVRTC